jgi:ATP-dependent helicase/nuclease subunit B
MFPDTDPAPRVFGLPPGAPFPQVLAAGVLARMTGRPPDALAGVEIFLNTGRMLRHVRAAFAARAPGLMPRLRLVGDIGAMPLPGLPPATPALARTFALLPLVRRLLAARRDDGHRKSTSGAQVSGPGAFQLAESLVALIAEMQDEGVTMAALDDPALAGDHAAHWQQSLAFLRIAAPFLAGDAGPDPTARQAMAVDALIARWQADPPPTPVILAGSTGSRGTTARLLRAVAGLPQGAVVLPGFDVDMPGPVWDALDAGPVPAEEHPQYRFLRLMRALGIGPGDVRAWIDGTAPDPVRNRLLSLALRPAPVTDSWLEEGAGLGDLRIAAGGMTLIEARDPADEAKAVALCLRAAVGAGRRAALVTPDRTLARRVAAALDRWGIRPDDSAGEPLSETPPGRLLRQLAGLADTRVTAGELLALFKHPLVATAAGPAARGTHLLQVRALELRLRRRGPAFPEPDDITAWAGAGDAPGRADWGRWAAAVLAALPAPGERGAADRALALAALAERLVAGADGGGGATDDDALWHAGAGPAARRALAAIARHGPAGGPVGAFDFAQILTGVLAAEPVRNSAATDPRVAIWGTLEARVQGADLTILAGLNEGVWPEAPPPDPWMSRPMRLACGLRSPDRRIGLSAHDFQQAAAAGEVVLSRSLRDAQAETVPSRWLLRILNLVEGLPATHGPAAAEAMRARGRAWTDLARTIERPAAAVAPARRPAPRPPAAVRPRELPVTAIRRLMTDPYAVYARHVLRLRPVDPLTAEADARDRGIVLHRILERFVGALPDLSDPAAARAQLIAAADAVLAEDVPWPVERRLWRARVARFAEAFLAAEGARRGLATPDRIEVEGRVLLPGGGFTLTARPDRIDRTAAGALCIYDYKSGEPPSKTDIEQSERQVALEGAMALRGAFTGGVPASLAALAYLGLTAAAPVRPVPHDADRMAREWADLEALIRAYGNPATGYAARSRVKPPPDNMSRREDYDDLARYGEWAMHDHPVPEDLS